MDVAGCVINNGGDVGVAVKLGVGGTNGAPDGVSVWTISATGRARTGLPPIGVGVWYCPHNDVLPAHEERNNDVTNRPA